MPGDACVIQGGAAIRDRHAIAIGGAPFPPRRAQRIGGARFARLQRHFAECAARPHDDICKRTRSAARSAGANIIRPGGLCTRQSA